MAQQVTPVPWRPAYEGAVKDIVEGRARSNHGGQASTIGSQRYQDYDIEDDAVFPAVFGPFGDTRKYEQCAVNEGDADIEKGFASSSRERCVLYVVIVSCAMVLAALIVILIFGLGRRSDRAVDSITDVASTWGGPMREGGLTNHATWNSPNLTWHANQQVLAALAGHSTTRPVAIKSGPSVATASPKPFAAEEELLVVPVRMPYGPRTAGVSEPCLGPIRVPPRAKSIAGFTPSVDLSVVHHLVVFGTSTAGTNFQAPNWHKAFPRGAVDRNSLCWQAPVLFSWARTGQKKALPFILPSNAGFEVGRGVHQTQWLYLDVHYQNVNGGVPKDRSGVNITFALRPRSRKMKVHWIHTENIRIPPRVKKHTLCTRCWVRSPGHVLAYRNHAHRLAVHLYSDLLRGGVKVREIGRTTGLSPQIYNLADPPGGILLKAGDQILYHCVYSSINSHQFTMFGQDERTKEMCNQYLMLEQQVQLDCDSTGLIDGECKAAESAPFIVNEKWPFSIRLCPGPFCHVGQVSGVDVDAANGDLYVFHRSGNHNFWNDQLIRETTIMRLTSKGKLIKSFGAGIFIVPHGLTVCRHGGMNDAAALTLWLTDTGLHQVLQMQVATEKIVVSLGERGKPGSGSRKFNKPTDVAVAGDGSLFIADGYGNSRIAVYLKDSSHGTYSYRRSFGRAGSRNGEFSTPHGVALDEEHGHVFVADRNNGRIQVFDYAGMLLSVWDAGIQRLQNVHPTQPWKGYVCAITYDKRLGVLFALVGDKVVMYDHRGNVLQQFGTNNGKIGALDFPHAISAGTVGGKSTVYVAELNSKRVLQFMAFRR